MRPQQGRVLRNPGRSYGARLNAQAYPTRPVRIVVGFAAGGGADIAARLIGQWLSDRLDLSFVIENRPGAGSNIGTEAVLLISP
jgi:tripartite-type tricarboxylate transporter receptor subunit TctC